MSTIRTNAVTAITADSNLTLSPNGTGKVVIDGLTYPIADGSANQVVKTNGSSGGIETADYRSQRSANTNGSIASDGTPNSNESKGFGITVDAAGNAFGGQMILSLHHPTNHTWTSSSSFRRDGFDHSWGAGSKDLSAELTQVRITTKGGSESFDAGTINIMYM